MKIIHALNMILAISLAHAASPVQAQLNPEGIEFIKTIEPNLVAEGLCNTRNKTSLQKRFFADKNALVEFLMDPSFAGAYGFEIDSVGNGEYVMNMKWVCDWEEVQSRMQTDFPTKRTSRDALKDKTEEERTAILQHNREQYIMRSKRANEVYTIKTKSHPIGRSLAIQLHKTYVSLIGNHKNTGIPNISKDGYTAVFRCVVGDEIWNFSTRNPLGAFKELTDLCEDIANDVKENKKDINEDEYVRRLEELMNAKSL